MGWGLSLSGVKGQVGVGVGGSSWGLGLSGVKGQVGVGGSGRGWMGCSGWGEINLPMNRNQSRVEGVSRSRRGGC